MVSLILELIAIIRCVYQVGLLYFQGGKIMLSKLGIISKVWTLIDFETGRQTSKRMDTMLNFMEKWMIFLGFILSQNALKRGFVTSILLFRRNQKYVYRQCKLLSNYNLIQPVAQTVGNSTTKRVGYPADWKNVRSIQKFLSQQNDEKSDPFMLYFGIYLPHPYQTPSAGINAGASTYKSSPYYLSKLNETNIPMPKWKPFEKEHPVMGFISKFTYSFSGQMLKS